MHLSRYFFQAINTKKLSKIGVTKKEVLLAVYELVQGRTPGNLRAPIDRAGWTAPRSREALHKRSWGVTMVDNFTHFKGRRNHGHHLVFSVRHEVSHSAFILISFWSGYKAEEVFWLRSADNWSPQKVSKEISSTHSSLQTPYVTLIKKVSIFTGKFLAVPKWKQLKNTWKDIKV